MRGIVETTPHDPVTIDTDYEPLPELRGRSPWRRCKRAGVAGPYAIALGPRCYTGVIETTQHGGYPVLEHLRLIVEGPVLWAPAVDGAVVLSLRGEDFELVVGQDLAIGYLDHDAERVTALPRGEHHVPRALARGRRRAGLRRREAAGRPAEAPRPDGGSRYHALNRKGSIPERRHRHDGRTGPVTSAPHDGAGETFGVR